MEKINKRYIAIISLFVVIIASLIAVTFSACNASTVTTHKITFDYDAEVVKVKFEGEYVSEADVAEGKEVKFIVEADNEYTIYSVEAWIKSQKAVVNPSIGNQYYISGDLVKDDIKIVVEARKVYNVNYIYSADEVFFVNQQNTAVSGEDIEIFVFNKPNYKIESVTVKIDGEQYTIDQNDYKYTIAASDFTGSADDIIVTVNSAADSVVSGCGVKYVYNDEEVTVIGPENISFGNQIDFTATPKDGYEIVSVTYRISDGSEFDVNGGSENDYTVETGDSVYYEIIIETQLIEYTYTINYYDYNGTVTSREHTVTILDDEDIALNNLTVALFDFKGWSDEAWSDYDAESGRWSAENLYTSLNIEDVINDCLAGNLTRDLYAACEFNKTDDDINNLFKELINVSLSLDEEVSTTLILDYTFNSFYDSRWPAIFKEITYLNSEDCKFEKSISILAFGFIYVTNSEVEVADSLITDNIDGDDYKMEDYMEVSSTTPVYNDDKSARIYGWIGMREGSMSLRLNNLTETIAASRFVKSWIAITITGEDGEEQTVVIRQDDYTCVSDVYN